MSVSKLFAKLSRQRFFLIITFQEYHQSVKFLCPDPDRHLSDLGLNCL